MPNMTIVFTKLLSGSNGPSIEVFALAENWINKPNAFKINTINQIL
jgi:hypothetical protein